MTAPFPDTLAAAQAGEEWANAALWRAHHLSLLRFLNGRAPDIAEDIESETWIHVARGLGRFRGNEGEFRAWLFTIARNCLNDWLRAARRRPGVTVDPYDLSETAAGDDPATEALDAIGTEAALALIRRLPPDQAEVLLLRVLGGLDVDRVASILAKRPGSVRVLQHRALRRLAEMLEAPAPRPVTR
jgi:RNA polymerase sigma-70 factor (ECF subfamily)